MKIDSDDFRVREGKKVNLKKWPTKVKPYYKTDKELKNILQDRIEETSDLQSVLYASNRYSVLLIFQAMDAAGKDSAIKHVMRDLDAKATQVFTFKAPSEEELDHDFMWRCFKVLPERGRIGVFNRSYYEEVLVVRVHPELLQRQQLPPERITRRIWSERFEDIRNIERYLCRNGTIIRKFFLNVSRSEQRRRFLARLDDPAKNWKFSIGDVDERLRWDDYMKAYEDAIGATSTTHAPWYVVPADNKWFTRIVVANIIIETLESLNLDFPPLDRAKQRELALARRRLRA